MLILVLAKSCLETLTVRLMAINICMSVTVKEKTYYCKACETKLVECFKEEAVEDDGYRFTYTMKFLDCPECGYKYIPFEYNIDNTIRLEAARLRNIPLYRMQQWVQSRE